MQNQTRRILRAAAVIGVTMIAALVPAQSFPEPEIPRSEVQAMLLPISSGSRAGAYGTDWHASLDVWNGLDQRVYFFPGPPDCHLSTACEFTVPAREITRRYVPGTTGTDGSLFYVEKQYAGGLWISYHLLRTGAPAEGVVTQLPVVRESQFLSGPGILPRIPVGAGSRITLRVYDVRPDQYRRARLRIFPASGQTPLVEGTLYFYYDDEMEGLLLDFPQSPGFAKIGPLGDAFPILYTQDAVRIEVSPIDEGLQFWFFATVTDNATQQVVLYTPQQ